MKKVLAISFALLILFSNMGFAINSHFCEGEAVKTSFSFGNEQLSCEMPMMIQNTEVSGTGTKIQTKPCCEDTHFDLKIKDEFRTASVLDHISPVFIIAFTHIFIEPVFFISKESATKKYTLYKSPFPERNIRVLFQTFLI